MLFYVIYIHVVINANRTLYLGRLDGCLCVPVLDVRIGEYCI